MDELHSMLPSNWEMLSAEKKRTSRAGYKVTYGNTKIQKTL